MQNSRYTTSECKCPNKEFILVSQQIAGPLGLLSGQVHLEHRIDNACGFRVAYFGVTIPDSEYSMAANGLLFVLSSNLAGGLLKPAFRVATATDGNLSTAQQYSDVVAYSIYGRPSSPGVNGLEFSFMGDTQNDLYNRYSSPRPIQDFNWSIAPVSLTPIPTPTTPYTCEIVFEFLTLNLGQ